MTNFTLRRLVPTGPKCQLVSSPPPTPQRHRRSPASLVRAIWSLVCLALVGVTLPVAAWAQAGSITGRVTDEPGTSPLVGARVQVIGTALSAQTLQDARYTIAHVPAGTYDVRVVAVGYSAGKKTATVSAGERATVDFALAPVVFSLEEIVITATGEQRKLVMGHAITSVRADSLVMYNPITNAASLLQGKAAGVAVLPS